MGEYLLLPLPGLSLLVGFLKALHCVQCTEVLSNENCKSSHETCEAKEGQKCLLLAGTLGQLSFVVQKCTDKCISGSFHNSKFRYTCCQKHSSCNKL
ncbi:hypothetical protein STEG23_036189 [Scotinomys teguina]